MQAQQRGVDTIIQTQLGARTRKQEHSHVEAAPLLTFRLIQVCVL